MVKIGSRETRLYPVTNNLFRRADDPVATVRFVFVDDTLFMQGELGNFKRTLNQPAAHIP